MPGRRPILPTGAAPAIPSRIPYRAVLTLVFALLIVMSMAACREQRLPEADATKRSLSAGKTLFERKCASCHGLTGDGRTMTGSRFKYANLIDGEWRGDGSIGSIEEQIRRGRDPMPKFEGKLTDEQIRETAAYVLDLSHRKGKK